MFQHHRLVAFGLSVLFLGVLVEAFAAFHLFFHKDPVAAILIVASWFREVGKESLTKLMEEI
jgi:hypothetical protein